MTQRLVVCFEAHRPDGRVWAVKVGTRWRSATHVKLCGVTLNSVYRGATARQPRAYFTGHGRVYWERSKAWITA